MPNTADIITRMLTDRETATKNAQDLATHWQGVADRQRKELESLEARLLAYRRAYGALHRAARVVVASEGVVDRAALEELARCVASKEGDAP